MLSCVSSKAVLVRVYHPSLIVAPAVARGSASSLDAGFAFAAGVGSDRANNEGLGLPMLLPESFAMPSRIRIPAFLGILSIYTWPLHARPPSPHGSQLE